MLSGITLTDIVDVFTVDSPKGRFEQIRCRFCYGISFCYGGRITYHKDGRAVVSDRDHVVLLPKGQDYSLDCDASGLFPVINVEFAPDFCITEPTAFPIRQPEGYLRDYERLRELFLLGGNRARCMSIVYDMLGRIADEHITGNRVTVIWEPGENVPEEWTLTCSAEGREDITGTTLSEIAKTIGVEELVTTGELAEYIGSNEATQIVNELKKILDQTQNMTDDEVRAEIKGIAEAYNVSITDAQVDQLLKLCRSLEKLDVAQLQEKLVSLTKTLEGAKQVESKLSEFAAGVKNFFGKVADFFSRLFGKGN